MVETRLFMVLRSFRTFHVTASATEKCTGIMQISLKACIEGG